MAPFVCPIHFTPTRLLLILITSDEAVTVTTQTPPKRVRIVGLTLDYGLLHTVEGGTGQPVDLMSDQNSFDMLAGLIKSKMM